MTVTVPRARLGVILSAGNWALEACFRAAAPADLGVHVTRMRMGSGGERTLNDLDSDIVNAARLLAAVKPDLIDLQGTGIMMERGPDGEAAIVAAIENATGVPAYTATGAAVDALRAAGVEKVVLVGPYGQDAIDRETAYLEASGLTVLGGTGLRREDNSSNDITPEEWIEAAVAADRGDADGIFFSGSNTRTVEAIAETERRLDKPVVTSVQAALWAGLTRLAPKLGPFQTPRDFGRLFATL